MLSAGPGEPVQSNSTAARNMHPAAHPDDDPIAAAPPQGASKARVSALWQAAAGLLTAERERWALWLPVAIGAGIALYFALPLEPPIWLGAAALAGLAPPLALAARAGRWVGVALLAAALATAAGFAAAQLRTHTAGTPQLDREIGPVRVVGRVVVAEPLDGAIRVLLDQATIPRLRPDEPVPRRVRLRLMPGDPAPPPGALIAVRAVVSGPSGPVAPDAFDFRRALFFQGIGAIGYAAAEAQIRAPPDGGAGQRLEALRQTVGARIATALEGDRAAIAAALLIGERGLIRDEVNRAIRDAGLAHLLAISGLHIGLVAGLVFFAVRFLLALAQGPALRRPIKKYAALAALLAAVGYMLLVGAPIPTQRAVLMTGLVLIAVLVDRTAISLRLVAWAAAAVLLTAPESLAGPSFQMSFAAVIALVAAYETMQPRLAGWRERGRAWLLPLAYLGGVLLTTIVASAATTPFALYHFQRLATYGLLSNLIAVPVTSFWIMPWGLAALALMPLGLEGPALTAMGWGIDIVLWSGHTAAAWPGAALRVPAMPDWGLAALALGGLWLCLWRLRWRLLGLPLILLGLASPALAPRPAVLVSGDGALAAVRLADDRLALSTERGQGFVRGLWLRRNGQEDDIVWPTAGRSADGTLACDALGCLYRPAGRPQTVALVRDPAALAEDCAVADIVVAFVPVRRPCPAGLVIDRFDLARAGAHALYLDGDSVIVRTAVAGVGDRPWAARR